MKKAFLFVLLSLIAGLSQASTKMHHRSEIHCLAQMIFFEARGEKPAGKIAVAHVTLNRVKHKKFPNTICGVISQPKQYQWYHNHKLRGGRVFSKERHEEIYQMAAKIYLNYLVNGKKFNDTSRGSLYFSSNKVRPHPRAPFRMRIGGHDFFGDVPSALNKIHKRRRG